MIFGREIYESNFLKITKILSDDVLKKYSVEKRKERKFFAIGGQEVLEKNNVKNGSLKKFPKHIYDSWSGRIFLHSVIHGNEVFGNTHKNIHDFLKIVLKSLPNLSKEFLEKASI